MLRLFFAKKNNKLEEELVEETIKMLGFLSDLKSKGKITDAVYNVEIQKKIAVLKSLNKTYEAILHNVFEQEAAATNERNEK
jgi:hypothetical protein